ncbi:methyl-accepting chemotaxis protein [Acetobacter malorum DSM 14337]|uniref:Methyl-accepting chemotaxis protein n=1 Tax=Acetobacter malorum DSM 14337 TaxID=1307910 RepID=A0ABQ0Q0P9_9PROT|nr:protoglobin domain-containing protein [Acetobacter malorum]GBQ86312.1 methyl-accepting chemotaxis protein [Acetobacter malorum DSM 14337]
MPVKPKEDAQRFAELASRLHFLSIGDKERECLQNLRKGIGPILDESLASFYERVGSNPELSHFFPSQDMVSSARDRQKQHWETILSANFGREYVENVTRIGNTHARIGLSPKWYIAGYAVLLDNMIRRIVSDYENKRTRRFGRQPQTDLGEMVGTLIRVALLDIDLSVSTYLDKLRDDREAAQEEGTAALVAIAQALDQMTEGNMSVTLDEKVVEKAPILATSFNGLKAGIGVIIGDIRDVSSGVKDSSRSIRNNVETLRERATSQMGAISDITQSSAILDKTVSDVLVQMEAATVTIDNFSTAVANGNGDVDALSLSIAQIGEAWRAMLTLVRDISEISTKIRMLALNAHIEASRAGEYGSGFSVIAESIRELAGTTGRAAASITELAQTSQESITSAEISAGRTKVVLSDIEDGVGVVRDVVARIDEAMKTQSSGARANHEVASRLNQSANQSVEQANKMTESCDKLVDQSGVLTNLVLEFDRAPVEV